MKLCGGDVQYNLLEVLSFLQWEDIDSIGWFECRRYIQMVDDVYIQIRDFEYVQRSFIYIESEMWRKLIRAISGKWNPTFCCVDPTPRCDSRSE